MRAEKKRVVEEVACHEVRVPAAGTSNKAHELIKHGQPHDDLYQRRQVEDKLDLLERLTASKNTLYQQISLEGQISAQNDIADRSLHAQPHSIA